jgi:hypothetical protein
MTALLGPRRAQAPVAARRWSQRRHGTVCGPLDGPPRRAVVEMASTPRCKPTLLTKPSGGFRCTRRWIAQCNSAPPRPTCSGRRSCAVLTSRTPSACSSNPFGWTSPKYATHAPGSLDLARAGRQHPTAARPRRCRGSTPALGTPGTTRAAHTRRVRRGFRHLRGKSGNPAAPEPSRPGPGRATRAPQPAPDHPP